MANRQDWLDAGLVILAEHGAPGLTIERLMARVGLTKGSFYHHFKGMPGFRTALLEHYEATMTTRYIETAVAGDPAPEEKIKRLLELVVKESASDPEVAIRAWAMQDQDVAAMLRRVDHTRIEFLRTVWQERSGDPAASEVMGKLLYLILVGANHMLPPIGGQELRALYAVVLGADFR
ncbi:TetR/AcrR family transcriptional regulator [Nonomuraea endophytica]|uniref:AcrR family transcriptional regulator n=1 Tax=Nonomuraea endophytica TaxID=714136 RepID=A0A7W8EEA4_9ACTN|nr:TetR/AcrR family transcriptional regulator [Nonomuraea endophytica]MBB5077455.1 AcrR family transcriptional regulator [Nonomuraea endophytica]